MTDTQSSTRSPSWYDVLDVDRAASPDEVRAAWRASIADLEPGSPALRLAQRGGRGAPRPASGERRTTRRSPRPRPRPRPAAESPVSPVEEGRLAPPLVEGPLEARPERTAPAGRGVPTWLLAVAGLVLVALVAGCAWAWQSTSGETEEEATRAAQAAAERAIVPVLSYGFETLEEDQARAQGYLTSDYREDYDQLFAVISDNAPQTQTTVDAEVVASGIVRSGVDRVDVLVFVDRPTTNKLTPEPETYKDQVTVTMQKVGDEWLVDNLVTSPAQG